MGRSNEWNEWAIRFVSYQPTKKQLYFSDHSISSWFGTHLFHSVIELLLPSTNTYILVRSNEWNGWAIPFVTYGVIWVSNSISEWNGWADPMSGMGGLFDL